MRAARRRILARLAPAYRRVFCCSGPRAVICLLDRINQRLGRPSPGLSAAHADQRSKQFIVHSYWHAS